MTSRPLSARMREQIRQERMDRLQRAVPPPPVDPEPVTIQPPGEQQPDNGDDYGGHVR